MERDFYTDKKVLLEPYGWFEEMRAKGPVCRIETRDLVLVTGFDEAVEILNNGRDWSSVISVCGPLVPLPFTPEGEDITSLIEGSRDKLPLADLIVTLDDGAHHQSRALISRLFTPSRLRANEEYMTGVAERMVQDVVSRGSCELISEISTPFVTYVVADLLGVPRDDREEFRKIIDAAPPPGDMESAPLPGQEAEWAAKEASKPIDPNNPMVFMGMFFYRYLADRREKPLEDVLSDLALAHYPDGTQPDLIELVRLSTFMFAAGQDTSAKLIGNAMRYLVDVPGLQDQLRAEPALIPSFIEEVLRLEGSTKATQRLARRNTRIGDMEIPVGTKVVVAIAAANRDPRRWEDPHEFKLNRPRIKEQIGFGRGAHTCAGAPLARVEVRIIFEKLLELTRQISLSEAHHGPPGHRRLQFEPSYVIRGLANLHLELEPR